VYTDTRYVVVDIQRGTLVIVWKRTLTKTQKVLLRLLVNIRM